MEFDHVSLLGLRLAEVAATTSQGVAAVVWAEEYRPNVLTLFGGLVLVGSSQMRWPFARSGAARTPTAWSALRRSRCLDTTETYNRVSKHSRRQHHEPQSK